ncbi:MULTISPECIES: hypothetical protein [Actinomycetes]|uniref:hypothetical protein n=1 Tax=Actinomycetes TaxID=1760 RepID=UPI0001B5714F|nr:MULTISPECIES: hypothetical protein [Actinomycetes]
MGEPLSDIAPAQMQAYVDAGEARRFSRSLGGVVPDAVKFRDRWYVREVGKADYTPAVDSLAAIFDDVEDPRGRFAMADQAVADADAREGR